MLDLQWPSAYISLQYRRKGNAPLHMRHFCPGRNIRYLYGLCITDIDLVKDYFRLIAECLGEMPSPETFRRGSANAIARRFLAFKLDWPFRSSEINRFG
jgi:hypothetical protein